MAAIDEMVGVRVTHTYALVPDTMRSSLNALGGCFISQIDVFCFYEVILTDISPQGGDWKHGGRKNRG